MCEIARDGILTNPFSLDEFKLTNIGIAASVAFEKHAKEIMRAVDCGDPPLAVVAGELDALICEGLYWRMVERMLAEWLGPSFEKAGRKPLPITIHRRGCCYARAVTEE